MEDKGLLETFEYLRTSGNAFVFYRLPDSSEVVCFYQTDAVLHQTATLDIDGFIMAPFLKHEQTPFIPATHRLNFKSPNTKVRSSELNIPEDANQKEAFISLVQNAKAEIQAKSFQKVVLSRPIKISTPTHPATVFCNLLTLYPSAMVSFWHHPKLGTWMGATPERLVTYESGVLKTMALAGTQLFCGTTQVEWGAKEIEEQQFVTDQLQTDLSKFFPKTTLDISKPYTKKAGNLLHLCTDFKVSCPLISLGSIVNQLHPTPAVGGIPKAAALSFLKTYEGYARAFYSGYFGPVLPQKINLFVNLRCARWAEDHLVLYVGAGITSGSDPTKEWEETRRKADTFLNAI